MAKPSEEPSPGEVIGQYRLDSLLGRGGMGSVFAATHVLLGKKRAVKILRDQLAADKVFLARFFHEAKIVTEIGHPNIIDVVDYVETEAPRRVAYVMELVNGPTLRGLLARYQTTREQTLNVGIQLVSALQAVHAINVVHRDLKPDNIIVVGKTDGDLSERPSIKILDFGIAKIFGREDVLETATGQVVGTPLYMAPEQIAAGPVSPATDTYAIAEILYEMGSGARVFPKDRVQALRMKLASTAPILNPPRWPDGDRFVALVHSCLCPDPNRRPSLEDLSSSLTELAARTLTKSMPIPRTPETAGLGVADATKAERAPSGPAIPPAPSPLSTQPGAATFDSLAASRIAPASKVPVVLSAAATLLAAAALVAVLLRDEPSERIAPSENVPEATKTELTRNVSTEPAEPAKVAETPSPSTLATDKPPIEPPPPPAEAPKPGARAADATDRAREKKERRGTLSTTPPGAHVVSVDTGEALGTTPVELPAGRVRLELEGYAPLELAFDGRSRTVPLAALPREGVVKKKKLNPW
ncbi:MAG: serine/threonine protein kinase [Deltaproteobacteria bacterium]|nr:serine/threonine protein kinase [Deltaproteobacteria bacterium]